MPSNVGYQQQQQEELQRLIHKERERSVQLHLFLLTHAARCKGTKCPSPNCARMKVLLRHEQTCQIRAKGGCGACKRVWALLHIHARQCSGQTGASPCRVPHCQEVRERNRRIQDAAKTKTMEESAATVEVVKI